MDRLSAIMQGQGALIAKQGNAAPGALERARLCDPHESVSHYVDHEVASLDRAPATTRGDDKYWEKLMIKSACTKGCCQEQCVVVDDGDGQMVGSHCGELHFSFANDGPNTRTFQGDTQKDKDAKTQHSEDRTKTDKELSTITAFDICSKDDEILGKAKNRLNQCLMWMPFVNDERPGGFRLSDDEQQSCKVSFHAACVQWAKEKCPEVNMASPVFWVIAAVQNAVALRPDGYKLPTEELRLRLTLEGMHEYLSHFRGEARTTVESERSATKVHGKKGVSKDQRMLESIKRRKARFDSLGNTPHKRYEKMLVFHKLLVRSKAWPSPKGGFLGLCEPVLQTKEPELIFSKRQACAATDFVATKKARMGLNKHTADDFDLEAMDAKANAAAAKKEREGERETGEKANKKEREGGDLEMFDEEERELAAAERKRRLSETAAAVAPPEQPCSAEATAAAAAATAAQAAAVAAQAAADAAAAAAAAAVAKAAAAAAEATAAAAAAAPPPPLASVGSEEAEGEEEEEVPEEVPEDFGLTGEERDALFDEEQAAMDAEAAWAAAMATAETEAVVPSSGGPSLMAATEAPKSLKAKSKGPRETDAQLARLGPASFLRSIAYNNCKTATDQQALKARIAILRDAYLLRIASSKQRVGALEAAKEAARKARADARAARLAKEEERHRSSLDNRGFNQILSQGVKKEKAEARLERGRAATYIAPTDEVTDRKGKTLAPMVIMHKQPTAPPIRISRAQWEAFNEVDVEDPKATVRVKMNGAKRALERTTEPDPSEEELKCNGGASSHADMFPTKSKRSRRS